MVHYNCGLRVLGINVLDFRQCQCHLNIIVCNAISYSHYSWWGFGVAHGEDEVCSSTGSAEDERRWVVGCRYMYQ